MIDLEVAAMDDPPRGRVDHEARAFGDRVAHGQKAHLEGPGLGHFGPRLNGRHLAGILPALVHLEPRNGRRKRAGIDRRAQVAPKVAHGAHMVFVGVGDEDRLDLIAPRLEPADIGHDEVDTGRCVHIGEGHAQIDDDQTL